MFVCVCVCLCVCVRLCVCMCLCACLCVVGVLLVCSWRWRWRLAVGGWRLAVGGCCFGGWCLLCWWLVCWLWLWLCWWRLWLGWLWCGPVCLTYVSVHIRPRNAPNYGSRVPVDTTPGPAPVCRALKIDPSFQLLRPTAGTGRCGITATSTTASVDAHNGHATTPAQPTSTTLSPVRNDRDVDDNDELQLRRVHSLQQSEGRGSTSGSESPPFT